MKNVIKNNPKYTKTRENIKQTDLLVIDECSTLSKKMFDCLSEVCAIKNENVSFGGIQLVLCGDFHQLAPVPNFLCQEDGEFCFRSHLFTTVLPHKITLTDVIRQSECEFIKAIQEVAVGAVTNESKKCIEKLNRPLPDGDSSITLFATNDHVDDCNRDSILEFIGLVYEFVSDVTGEKRYLSHILPPHILLLKIGTPITKTCLYNFDPLKSHFYVEKLGFTRVYIIFLIFAKNTDCEYSLEPPRRGGSNEYPQSMF